MLSDEAEALARALELGICDVTQVIAWSDAQIAHVDLPSGALCEVALASDRYPQDVANLLRQCPGTPHESAVRKLLLTLLNDRLEGDLSRASQIASALYNMTLAEQIDDSELEAMGWWAWDALDLGELGYTPETREQVAAQMAQALDRAATNAAMSAAFAAMLGKPTA